MGRIAIEGMKFYAHHGYYHDERKVGNHFIADVYLETDFQKAAESDELSGTINYEDIWELTRQAMEEPSFLIEHVALRLYRSIRERFAQLSYCRVRISKLNPPLKGEVARTWVELDSEN